MNPLDVRWIHGAPDCSASRDPVLQVHRFERDTYILRQSKCSSFEAPFIYLLIGGGTALLVDTGARPVRGTLPIAETVMHILDSWRAERGVSVLELIVAHSHSHGDHVFGDSQFGGAPRTRVVAPWQTGVKSFFGLPAWPSGTATLDLGERRVTIVPIPGHEDSHIALYDERTRVLLTGDALYAGKLTVRDWNAYRRSAARLEEFAASHEIEYVLGCHVEMKRTARQLYPIGTLFQPDEHVLQLTRAHVAQLGAACAAHPRAQLITLDEFIIEPVRD